MIGPHHKLGALAMHGNQTHRQLLVSTLFTSLRLSNFSMQKVNPKANQEMKKERKVSKKASMTMKVTLTIQKANKKVTKKERKVIKKARITIQVTLTPVPPHLTHTLAGHMDAREHGCTDNVQTSAASITNASETGTVRKANQKVIKASAKHQMSSHVEA